MSDILKISQAGHVRTIQLNRPQVKNALSDELAWGIVEAVREASQDDETWVIAITGTGDAFCAGLDLGGGEPYSPFSPQTAKLDDIHWVGHFPIMLRAVCDKPVIAGVNGVAVGAGFALAMAADIRIVARSARLMAGYTRIGGSPDGGLAWTLPQAIGYESAMRFMLENKTVLGEEAVAMGLAGEVVDDEALPGRLADYAAQVANWSPITTRMTKRSIGNATRLPDLPAHVRLELSNIRRAFQSEDGQEARRAFFEKRPPVFQGK